MDDQSNAADRTDRVLARRLAVELTSEEIAIISGASTSRTGSHGNECKITDCDLS